MLTVENVGIGQGQGISSRLNRLGLQDMSQSTFRASTARPLLAVLSAFPRMSFLAFRTLVAPSFRRKGHTNRCIVRDLDMRVQTRIVIPAEAVLLEMRTGWSVVW